MMKKNKWFRAGRGKAREGKENDWKKKWWKGYREREINKEIEDRRKERVRGK